jgi:prepilin-type N-terminal cleavage/methylation domain-containing protein
MKSGFTLVEMSLVITLLALIAGIAVPRFSDFRDHVAVDGAVASTEALLSTARHAALRRGILTAVSFDSVAAIITVFSGADTLARRPLGAVHGVRLAVTRDSIAFSPTGMGYGLANTRVIFTRGSVAETLTVSRLGRVRR